MEYIQFIGTIVIILVIFFIADSQRRRQNKDLKQMQSKIKVGDKIITYSGLSGEVFKENEDNVIIKLNPSNIEVSIQRWAIAGIDDIKS